MNKRNNIFLPQTVEHKKTMKNGIGNPSSSLGQAQKCD
jgi:hypothetical protein